MLRSKAPTPLKVNALPDIQTEKVFKNSNDHVIPSHPFRCILSGMSGSGKSNLLITMLMKPEMYYGFFKHILIISPNIDSDKSYKHLLKDEVKQLKKKPKDKSKITYWFFKEYDQDAINDIMNMRMEAVEQCIKTPMLIVLDDILKNRKLLNSSFLQGLFTKGRHLKISTFICTQSYMKLDRTLRLNATNLIWFQPKNVSEIKRVYDELIRDMTLDQFIKLCNAVYSKRFNFLNLRIGAEPSKYMTLNFEHWIVLPSSSMGLSP